MQPTDRYDGARPGSCSHKIHVPGCPGTCWERPERRGGWIQTASGRRFYPLDPRAGEIRLFDVAHALGNLCRFAGHSQRFYSVAEHSVLVSQRVEQLSCGDRLLSLAGLLHDAPEAFVVDLPRPIKHMPGLAAYRAAEDRLALCVEDRFGLPTGYLEHPIVKRADNDLLLTERRDLLAPNPASSGLWAQGALGDAIELEDLYLRAGPGPGEASRAYIARFYELRGEVIS